MRSRFTFLKFDFITFCALFLPFSTFLYFWGLFVPFCTFGAFSYQYESKDEETESKEVMEEIMKTSASTDIHSVFTRLLVDPRSYFSGKTRFVNLRHKSDMHVCKKKFLALQTL